MLPEKDVVDTCRSRDNQLLLSKHRCQLSNRALSVPTKQSNARVDLALWREDLEYAKLRLISQF